MKTMLPSLGFQLHHFRRVAWVSSLAEDKWRPRLGLVRETVKSLEVLSFLAGMRDCYETTISVDKASGIGAYWKSMGKEFCVLGNDDSEKNLIRCVAVDTSLHLAKYRKAFDSEDHETMGRLNGYPDCCSQFYHEYLSKAVDPIWSIAGPGNHGSPSISIRNDLYFNNILLRVIGIAGIFHYPCSFNCTRSQETGLRICNLASSFEKYKASVTHLAEILRWPMLWTVLHGIAEIKTPVFKIIYDSESTPTKYSITLNSEYCPVESGRGVTFPYNKTTFGLSRHTSNGIWYYEDNNFSSLESMVTNHQPIVESVVKLLRNRSGGILDLGCGNGALLKTICDTNPNLTPFGMDISQEKIERAKHLHPLFRENFVQGNINEIGLLNLNDSCFLMTLVSIARVMEITSREGRSEFLSFLKTRSKFLLFYSYQDSQKFGSIRKILDEVDLEMTMVSEEPNIVIIKP